MELAAPHPTPTDPAPADPGAPATAAPAAAPGPGKAGEIRLHRDRDGRMVAGVAAGLADYLDVDPTVARIGFVALVFLGGLAVPLYLAGWLLIPEEGAELSVAEELLDHHAR